MSEDLRDTGGMRVCITLPSIDPRFGGPVMSAAGLAGGFRSSGHEVVVVGCGNEGADVNLPSIGRFHSTPIPASFKPIGPEVRRADVVHVLGYRDPVGTVAMLAARKSGIPFVLEPLGMYGLHERSRLLKRFYEVSIGARLLRRAAAIIVTSRLEAAQFTGTDVTGILHIRPNGIDNNTLRTDLPTGAIRDELSIPEHDPLVISVGRVTRKKRIDHLVQAIHQLDGYRLLIAGPDSGDGGMEVVEEERRRLGVGERVIILPEGLWGERKVRALLDSDCFCLPSSWETSSIAILEAAALGIPVVASDRCGGMEFLGRAGTLIAPFGDPVALARLIRTAVEDGNAKKTAIEEAERLRRELDWTQVAARQMEIYEANLAG